MCHRHMPAMFPPGRHRATTGSARNAHTPARPDQATREGTTWPGRAGSVGVRIAVTTPSTTVKDMTVKDMTVYGRP